VSKNVAFGRTFLHPAFDVLVIGGGISLLFTVALWTGVLKIGNAALAAAIPYCVLLSPVAHFAASTVRLYTKEGAFEKHPFLTMGLPLTTLVIVTLAIWQPESLGRHVQALYLTWSPFHYSAQAYGLAVMYAYRSGCALADFDKRLLHVTCFAPFLYSFTTSPGVGLEWILPQALFVASPAAVSARDMLGQVLGVVSFVAPVALYANLMRVGKRLPLISLLTVVSNAIWWMVLVYANAFVWVTVFHGIQYMGIILVFHVREQLARPDNTRGWIYHTAYFYGLSVALGWALFQVWPFAFRALGFGWVESVLLVAAVVNIHHFFVDGFIWRLRRDTNYRVVTGGVPDPVA